MREPQREPLPRKRPDKDINAGEKPREDPVDQASTDDDIDVQETVADHRQGESEGDRKLENAVQLGRNR